MILLVCILTLYLIYLPSIDYTREGKYILWYGRNKRKYIVLKI